MRFRKLRIAWTVLGTIACVLLIALWVRSNYWVDQLFVPVIQSAFVVFGSVPNAFGVGLTSNSPTGTWAMGNMPAVEWLAAVSESSDPWSGAVALRIVDGGIFAPYWFGLILAALLATLP